ncbi:MAG: hypothetical protein IJM90_01580 [Firmicutes bacterium]|nr:hypothetical protein [Bacillota bacterium]
MKKALAFFMAMVLAMTAVSITASAKQNEEQMENTYDICLASEDNEHHSCEYVVHQGKKDEYRIFVDIDKNTVTMVYQDNALGRT